MISKQSAFMFCYKPVIGPIIQAYMNSLKWHSKSWNSKLRRPQNDQNFNFVDYFLRTLFWACPWFISNSERVRWVLARPLFNTAAKLLPLACPCWTFNKFFNMGMLKAIISCFVISQLLVQLFRHIWTA